MPEKAMIPCQTDHMWINPYDHFYIKDGQTWMFSIPNGWVIGIPNGKECEEVINNKDLNYRRVRLTGIIYEEIEDGKENQGTIGEGKGSSQED